MTGVFLAAPQQRRRRRQAPGIRPAVTGVHRLRRLALFTVLNPVMARPGYWFATGCGLLWGAALGRGRFSREGGVIVARGLPSWAYGRGGTTIGAVFLTTATVSPAVLQHEAVHRRQWRRFGLAFAILYPLAGMDATRNRFEIEAGLREGGYL